MFEVTALAYYRVQRRGEDLQKPVKANRRFEDETESKRGRF